MERFVKLSDVKSAMTAAFEKYRTKTADGAAPDPRVAGMNADKMAISVCLTDGTCFDVGDSQSPFAMGSLLRIPLYTQLYTQMSPMQLAQKMGKCGCSHCSCHSSKPKGIHAKNIRLVSLVQPVGDADGKMEILSKLMISLMGSSPMLDDNLYKTAVKKNCELGVENMLATNDYELYDDAPVAIDIATKLHSMLVTTQQLAQMGATIAADGVNPMSGVPVFDGRLSENIVAMMAAKGPKKMRKPWMTITGVPAMSSFGGGFMTVIPGFGSIAAFSPELIDGHVPFKAAMAMREIVTTLDLNVFASARVKVKKE